MTQEINFATVQQNEGNKISTNNKISFKFSKRHDSTKIENVSKPQARNYTIKTYKLRWLILIVICLINITNTINWICYSPIADFTGKFYNVDYTQVNFLSIVSMIIAVPASIMSFVVIDYFGIRLSLNLAAWLNFGGTLLRVLSSIDGNFIPKNYKYFLLLIGQIIISIGGPFGFLVTTKFAQSWFTESQRALANTVALSSATFGALIGAVIPSFIVYSPDNYAHQMSNLNIITSVMSLIPALLAVFINRSTPPTPPSLSSNHQIDDSKNINNTDTQQPMTFREHFRIYFQQVKKLLKSPQFMFLLVSFSLSFGLFNTLATLLQQIFCVRGYSDTDVGLFGGIMISSGIISSIISGIIVDKTKRFEEISKICFCTSCVTNIILTIIQDYTNDNSFIKYGIIIAFCMIGIFGLPLLPVSSIS
jgi:FLVCR family MFS transporter 7